MDQTVATQTQDALRSLRQFVGAFQAGLGSDQSMAGTDASASNPPGQFSAVGMNGAVAVEGQPILTSGPQGVGLNLPSWVVWVGLGLVVYHFAK